MAANTGRAAFAAKLTRGREAAGLSQSELARRLGVSQPTISSWEAEDSEPTSHEIVYAAEATLEVARGSLTQALWGCVPCRESKTTRQSVMDAIDADPDLTDVERRVVFAVYREIKGQKRRARRERPS